jgi:hypothetical protein
MHATARLVAPIPPAALAPKDAAAYLSVGITFLRGLPITPLRIQGTGKGRREKLLYLVRDLDAWLEAEAARRPDVTRTA